MRRALCALAVSALLPAAAAAGVPAAHLERLPDGMELIVIHEPGTRTGSLRFVVRAGASLDPRGRAGLAHLLEHLVFQGVYEGNGSSLAAAVYAAGGDINAHTSQESTVYTLDAPAELFAPLAERYIAAITNPPLERVDLLRELGVVATEGEFHDRSRGILAFLENTLFAHEGKSVSIIGTRESRESISREDLIRFYTSHYVTTAVTVVVAGDLPPEGARALVSRSVRLPPALSTERPALVADVPEVPLFQTIHAPFSVAVFGYQIEPKDHRLCRGLADLLELRLLEALVVKEPLASAIEVDCRTLRGNEFVLAYAFTRALWASDLPEIVSRVFAESAKSPSYEERKLLLQRAQRRREGYRNGRASVVDEIAAETTRSGTAGTDLGFLAPQAPSRTEIEELARRAFTDERRIRLYLSPFSQ